MNTDDELWQKLEEKGVEAVGVELAKGVYGSASNKRQLVEQWLRMKDQSRADDVMREQIEVAREAAVAARDAAIEASTANKNAKIASAIAATAVIVSIIALFLK